MIKKISEKIIKNKTIMVTISFIIFLLVVIFIFLYNSKDKKILKSFENDNYKVSYDSTWKLNAHEKNMAVLKHYKNGIININIIKLEDENKFLSVDDLIQEIMYSLQTQNNSFKLISKKDTLLTKNEYKGYKILYENDNKNVMSSIYKKGDKLVVINYESDFEHFDILFDSVENIIYNFDIKEENYSLSSKIKIENKKITYSEDKALDKKYKKSMSYEIADSNYYVKYEIPDIFKSNIIDSSLNSFSLEDKNNNDISIVTTIRNANIYQLLDEDDNNNVYKEYNYYFNDKDYSKFEEYTSKVNENKYIYINSYYYDKASKIDEEGKFITYSKKIENVKILQALNKNHTLIITIESEDSAITKKLIDSIKIKEIKNYSSYITSKEIDNMLVAQLKRYKDYEKDTLELIDIKLPIKYKEIQQYNEIYSNRIFGLNYDDEKELYEYEIEYELVETSKIESKISSFNDSFPIAYGEYNYLTENENLVLSNREFNVYSGGYTKLGGIMFTNINRFRYYVNKKVLFYKMPTKGFLIIKISGNSKEIDQSIISDATNFVINYEKVK